MRAFYKTLPTQQPTFITEPSVSNQANTYALSYSYGADYERVKGILTLNGTLQNTRYYLGSYEKNVISGIGTEWVHYVSGADGLAAIVTITNAMAPTYHYVFKDHLGSILRVTNAAGTPEADQSFDAWGRRRNPTTWAYTSATAPTQTWLYRGYTAHEHLDQFALINMNGRLYDPTVGRMLSPDNYVQDALYAQTFNRYSYANNNPLKYIDPSGEIAWFVPVIIGAVIGAYTGASVQSGTFDFTHWDSDAWKGAIVGAFIGAGIGSAFSGIIHATGVFNIANGAIGKAYGLTSTLIQGGNTNMVTSLIMGHGSIDNLWKSAIAGSASGIYSASGGFGLASAGLAGKLAYAAIGSAGQSMGNNWANGGSNVSIAAGPVNLTLSKGKVSVRWQNNLGNIAMNVFGLINTAFGGKAEWDWNNLTPIYSGGMINMPPGVTAGFSPYVVTGTTDVKNIIDHEVHHVWQSRSLGDMFFPHFIMQGTNAFFMNDFKYYRSDGYDAFISSYNYLEAVEPKDYPWW